MRIILDELPTKFSTRRCSASQYKVVLNPSLRKPRKPRGNNAKIIAEREERERQVESEAVAADEALEEKITGIVEASHELIEEVLFQLDSPLFFLFNRFYF